MSAGTRAPSRESIDAGHYPTPMKSPRETREILDKLEPQHPGADTELHFTTPFELLTATILSAQSTDALVNTVTPALFKRYPNARALARATTAQLEPQIHSTGFFRAKSKSLLGMAQALVANHGGEVPKTMEELVELPGVGRKTANVVLGHALGVPGLPVDRHVLRVANRIGIAESDDPIVVEQQLCDAMPPERWTRTSDTLILHGRRICRPKPLCDECFVRDECDYFRMVVVPERDGRTHGSAPTKQEGRTRRSAPTKKAARARSTRATASQTPKHTPVGADLRVRPKKKPIGTKRVRKARR
jgi:endonuclease-3